MRVLWVHAHPEPRRSLAAALRAAGFDELRSRGHAVEESDLYAMEWQPVLSAADFPARDPGEPLVAGRAQEEAHRTGTLAPDIRREQEKLQRADTLVVQFPLWWHGLPAILKGWFDRVFAQGFASAVTDGEGRTLRYGAGGLAGRRALAVTSVGARESGFRPRGVHGGLEHVLFPLLHGTFWYTGMAPLHPFAVTGADRLDADGVRRWTEALRTRLAGLPDEEPIPYRTGLGGDYDERLLLREHLAPGEHSLDAHLRR